MRLLKFHERKLLKKTDLLNYKHDQNHRDVAVMRRYHVQNRDDYMKYNRVCGRIRQLAHELSLLDPKNPFRVHHERLLLEKLYDLGILARKHNPSDVENHVTVAAFCRRRLAVILTKVKMAETVSAATRFIEQGHIRVGPEVVTDPAFLVTRNMEDFVTWVDTSKFKRHIATYNDKLDDYDLL